MTSQLLDEYHILNTIIEQDKRVSSFKYALLRGTIEICQQYAHLEEETSDRVWYPLGLLVEKWIFYYYPIFESEFFIPQLNGEKGLDQDSKNISFRKPLSEIIEYYRTRGGISVFYSDYRKGNIPENLQETMRDLIRKIRWAIIDGPFQHLGHSQYDSYYSVFDWDRGRLHLPKTPISPEYLISYCGRYSVSPDLALLFKYFGSFILGEGSILNKWAEFTTQIGKAQGLSITREQMLNILGTGPDTEREQIQRVTRIYDTLISRQGEIPCVWSGHPLKTRGDIHIDHMLPFSLWKNNDLWNLMPAKTSVNAQKSDKIPSPDFITSRQEVICRYWETLEGAYPDTFQQEIVSSLTGRRTTAHQDWIQPAFSGLLEKSRYLIDIRGYTAWAL
jgi:hypothetical protein